METGEYGMSCIVCLEPATENISGEWYCKSHVPTPEKTWGGKREGAGRKAQGTTYQEGYQAGYQAAERSQIQRRVFIVYTLVDGSEGVVEVHGDEEERNERQAAELELRSKGTLVRSWRVELRPRHIPR